MHFKVGIRSKILAISSLLLLLPWFAYQFIIEIEDFLKQGQQQTLLNTTSAIATSMHERGELFNTSINETDTIKAGQDLYVYHLNQSITLDGNNDDWVSIKGLKNSYRSESFVQGTKAPYFNQLIGKRQGYLYTHLEVINSHPIYRNNTHNKITDNDHLLFAFSSPTGELKRYIVSVTSDGWFNAYQLPKHSIYAQNLTRVKDIQGIWKSTKVGYNIELRIPLSMVGDKLGFQLHTAKDVSSSKPDNVIQTSPLLDINKLGSVLIPSPEIENILLAMRHTHSRLWVVDKYQRVIAKAGNIYQATGAWPSNTNLDESEKSIWQHIEESVFAPLYAYWIKQPNQHFPDLVTSETQLNSAVADKALTGTAASQWQLTSDESTSILSAAHPIIVNNKVVGAIIAEQTNQGILALANQALQKTFNVLLGVLLVVIVVLSLFLSTIVKRISVLRDQSENMVDENGRLTQQFPVSRSRDEIGDLSRSMANMQTRLSNYHHYIEQLSSRLSHELRTPIAIVRSSLDNLASMPANSDQEKYIQRSQQGIQRLNKMLTSMSEASRIEESLQKMEKQDVDLNDLLTNCLQGYQMIYSDSIFELTITEQPLVSEVDPDFIVQLLDKVIHNAISFCDEGEPITIKLNQAHDSALIVIENKGPLLKTDHKNDLFQSMVSIRPSTQQHDSHLGFGLYIAKMICDHHQGEIRIDNNPDLTAVLVTIKLPLKSI